MKGSGQNWVLRLQWATSLFFSVGFGRPDPLWIPFKEVAVTLIYQMAEGPDVICAQILQGCAKQALEKLEEKSTPQDDPSKWARGSMGTVGRSQLLLLSLPDQKPLPPPLLTITPDPLSPLSRFCHSSWAIHHHHSHTLTPCCFTSLCST